MNAQLDYKKALRELNPPLIITSASYVHVFYLFFYVFTGIAMVNKESY